MEEWYVLQNKRTGLFRAQRGYGTEDELLHARTYKSEKTALAQMDGWYSGFEWEVVKVSATLTEAVNGNPL